MVSLRVLGKASGEILLSDGGYGRGRDLTAREELAWCGAYARVLADTCRATLLGEDVYNGPRDLCHVLDDSKCIRPRAVYRAMYSRLERTAG